MNNKLTYIGLSILIIILAFCIFGPFFSPYGEYEIFYIDSRTNKEVRMNEETIEMEYLLIYEKAPISLRHWLGTDIDGRDVFTRLMYGGRISLIVAFGVIIMELIIGVILGSIAGYFGGLIDRIIMRIVEIFFCIPFIPIMLIISSIMLSYDVLPKYRIYFIMLVMGLFEWAKVARIIRAQVLSLRNMEYIKATEAMGANIYRKIFKHFIPNMMPMIILIATMDIGTVILMESVLSYLGVGIAFPYASWGNMVTAVKQSSVLKEHWNIWVPPGVCILLTVLAFHFIGDGLRERFDPKIK